MAFELRAEPPEAAEPALADAFEAGAAGLEEREGKGGATWVLYAPAERAEAVAGACAAHAPAVWSSEPRPVPEQDWSERWKQGLEPIELGSALCVRPSFVAGAAGAETPELVIDPGQAFGTGGHASTRLALEWVVQLAPGLPPGARVLDVGCGTGVLALAALRLGARRAVALDLDPLAARAARDNAAANGLESGLLVLCGPVDALRPAAFELVVANLLRRELLPLLPGIAAQLADAGHLVLSGLLAHEAGAVTEACERVGLTASGERGLLDANGDRWVSLLTWPRPR